MTLMVLLLYHIYRERQMSQIYPSNNKYVLRIEPTVHPKIVTLKRVH